MAATAFLSADPVLKYLSNTLRRPEESLILDDRMELRKAEKAIKGLKVAFAWLVLHIFAPPSTYNHTDLPQLHSLKRLEQPWLQSFTTSKASAAL